MKSLQIIREIQAMLQKDYHTKILGLSNVSVEEIFRMYNDGKTVKQIVDYLNAKNIRTRFDRPMSINKYRSVYAVFYRFALVKENPNKIIVSISE